MNQFLDNLRGKLADVDAVPQLALLGILSGILAGVCILGFRALLEIPQKFLLPGHNQENYEALSWHYHLLMPLIGAIILGVIFQWGLSPKSRMVGVVHVIARHHNHQGWLDLKNMLVQFFAGAFSLFSGHSAGREGPAVHLGAASGSLLGQWLNLPNNSIRTLVACGSAAAIAASFNTPIAGVVFAMEVVMMEYTFSTVTPVILASVTGAVVSRAVYGHDPAFIVPPLQLSSLFEIPFLVLMGVVAGGLSALFIYLTRETYQRSAKLEIWQRFTLAGLVVGGIGVAFPEVLGIGYDTVNEAMTGEIQVLLLIGILFAKIIATAACVGFGLPAGLIGPTFVMGACLGGALGATGAATFPEYSASAGFYAMLGMAAMMGATLQAPLAALLALLELTSNPNIILPGMLVVVSANLICSEALKQKSIFLTLLKAQGLDYRSDPLSQWLDRAGVQSVMDRSFIRHGHEISYHDIHVLMENSPRWLLIDKGKLPIALMPMADLARYVQEQEALPEGERPNQEDVINLLGIPAHRKDLAELEIRSTLREALDLLREKNVEAIFIKRMTAPMITRVYGVITRKDIERYYTKVK